MKRRGSLTKLESGKWRARVTLDGKRHSKTFPLRRQAVEWLNAAEADAQRGVFTPPDKLRERVGDRLDAWLDEKEAHPTFSRRSLEVYTSHVEVNIRPTFGNLRMEDVSAERIRTWQYDLASIKSNATAQAAMRVLGSFLSSQVADGYIQQHPFERIRREDRVKHRPREMTILEPHELRAVVDVLRDGPVAPDCPDDERELRSGWRQDVVLGLAFIGCRVGDLSRLRPGDWDRVNDRLLVRDSKTGNDRRIPVFAELRSVLERCVARGGEYLFMTDGLHGQAIIRGQAFAQRHFTPALKKAGIERHVRVHDLRHGCASWLIRMGFGPVHVAAYLGHTSAVTTMKTYSHLFADDFADMGDALEQMWTTAHGGNSKITPLREAR